MFGPRCRNAPARVIFHAMAASAQQQPVCRREDATSIVHALRKAGHVAYFAGGCVRDQLLGIEPKDFDVATDAPPARVRELFPKTQAVGQAFGVILVRLGLSVIEVATFRSDGVYPDGRRPDSIEFATPQQDARRRDFTINGLFFDPIENTVIDFVGGQTDLQAKLLRCIGDPAQRFAEDYLRMLRAARFAARFDLTIEPTTIRAIHVSAAKLARISPERIADELRAMLEPPTRAAAARWLDTLSLLPVLFRGFELARPVAIDSIAGLSPANVHFPLALASLAIDALHPAGRSIFETLAAHARKKIVAAMRNNLKLSNDETAALTTALEVVELIQHSPAEAQLKRFMARPFAAGAFALAAAIAGQDIEVTRIAGLLARVEPIAKTDFAPTPLVNGDDLVAAGHRPGPSFGPVLDRVYDLQLEGMIHSREQAMKVAAEMLTAT